MSHGKMWHRKFAGDTGLGQATCKPSSHPNTPRSLPIFYTTKKVCARSRVPPCSSQSFMRVGEHIWQPLSARPLFVLQASLSSHKRLTTWLFKVRFKMRVTTSARVWKFDTKKRKTRSMWKSSPYFLWWLYYKRNILVVLEKTCCPGLFPWWKREDFVQIYLFHINVIRFKTRQYISGASTIILSKVCQRSISISVWNGNHWAGSWWLYVISPLVLLRRTLTAKTMWRHHLKSLIEQLKVSTSPHVCTCGYHFFFGQMSAEENHPQTAWAEMQPCHREFKRGPSVNH